MSIQTHVFKYKTENGTWKEIPFGIIDMYNMYVKYCEENNITAVSKDTYYATVGSLQTLVSGLNEALGNTTAITAIAEALNNGVLPQSLGGTGYGSLEELCAHLASNKVSDVNRLSTKGYVDTVRDTLLKDLEQDFENKVDGTEFQYGTEAPDPHVPGTYYFQYQ